MIKRNIVIFVLLIFIINNRTYGQNLAEMERALQPIALDMNKNQDDKVRLKAADDFLEGFKKALAQENAYAYAFDSLKVVSFLNAPDASFRVITWQVFVTKNQYAHYGFIQMADGVLHELTDRSDVITYPARKQLDASEWYGALYYSIKDYKSKDKTYYILFGFDANGLFLRSKLLDVLTFKDGKPYFGAPIFEVKKVTPPRSKREKPMVELVTRHRFILDYSAESSISLNYNPDIEAIMFDHLQQMEGRYQGQGATFLPDGTYEAFKWTGEKFDHIVEVPIQVLDKPLMDEKKKVSSKKKEKRGILGELRK